MVIYSPKGPKETYLNDLKSIGNIFLSRYEILPPWSSNKHVQIVKMADFDIFL